MYEFNLDELCDSLEYDLIYDKEELNRSNYQFRLRSVKEGWEGNHGFPPPQIKQLDDLISRRLITILKIIGDNYIQDGIPDRLLDIYLKTFAFQAYINHVLHTPEKTM